MSKLYDGAGKPVSITKKPADTEYNICRISIGGGTSMPDMQGYPPGIGGYYLVYRGRKEDCIDALETVLAAMKNMAAEVGPYGSEPPLDPERGKRFA